MNKKNRNFDRKKRAIILVIWIVLLALLLISIWLFLPKSWFLPILLAFILIASVFEYFFTRERSK